MWSIVTQTLPAKSGPGHAFFNTSQLYHPLPHTLIATNALHNSASDQKKIDSSQVPLELRHVWQHCGAIQGVSVLVLLRPGSMLPLLVLFLVSFLHFPASWVLTGTPSQ